jgi:HEAT repeat protein
VVITLGKYKDPQGVQPLIDLIEKIIKSPVEKDNVKLLGFTMD